MYVFFRINHPKSMLFLKVLGSADQVRHVYAGTTEPGAELGSDGDIYLMYSE